MAWVWGGAIHVTDSRWGRGQESSMKFCLVKLMMPKSHTLAVNKHFEIKNLQEFNEKVYMCIHSYN